MQQESIKKTIPKMWILVKFFYKHRLLMIKMYFQKKSTICVIAIDFDKSNQQK